MSNDLYEVLSLAARYLFTFLGVLIVLRVFLWLVSDHAEKARRLRGLPDSGYVGEFVVLSGSSSLPDGTSVPVPWEGVMGSVRFCDVVIPCEGVRNRHLSFSFQPDSGLVLHLFSGCYALLDGNPLDCRSKESDARMFHGSFLQIGSVLLRLRLFAGLDPNAGFEDSSPQITAESDHDSASRYSNPGDLSPLAQNGFGSSPGGTRPVPPIIPPSESLFNSSVPPLTDPGSVYPSGSVGVCPGAGSENESAYLIQPDGPSVSSGTAGNSEAVSAESAASGRRRRSERWEADWSD